MAGHTGLVCDTRLRDEDCTAATLTSVLEEVRALHAADPGLNRVTEPMLDAFFGAAVATGGLDAACALVP